MVLQTCKSDGIISSLFFCLFSGSEWIDFPRGDQHLRDGRIIPGNNLSYDKCRRRFDLVSLFLQHDYHCISLSAKHQVLG